MGTEWPEIRPKLQGAYGNYPTNKGVLVVPWGVMKGYVKGPSPLPCDWVIAQGQYKPLCEWSTMTGAVNRHQPYSQSAIGKIYYTQTDG